MSNILVSIHVPKSGGSTFRSVLSRVFENVYFDYDQKPLSSDDAVRKVKTLAKDNVRYLEILKALADKSDERCVVHGHFLASRYSTVFPDARYSIWFRDPVERLISHYYYWLRYPDNDHTLCKQLIENKLPLGEFARLDQARNVHCRFMDQRPLDQFDFVGITEQYDRSLRLFLKIFSPATAELSVAPLNRNPEKKSLVYDIDDDTRRVLEKYNEQDRQTYEYAKQRFGQLCRAHRV